MSQKVAMETLWTGQEALQSGSSRMYTPLMVSFSYPNVVTRRLGLYKLIDLEVRNSSEEVRRSLRGYYSTCYDATGTVKRPNTKCTHFNDKFRKRNPGQRDTDKPPLRVTIVSSTPLFRLQTH